MQHRQQLVLLDEVKDGWLLLAQVDGQGQVVTALDLVQLGRNLEQCFCIAPWSTNPADSVSL